MNRFYTEASVHYNGSIHTRERWNNPLFHLLGLTLFLLKLIDGLEVYGWSPAIVRGMKGDEEFKKEVKGLIDDIMPFLEGIIE